MNDSERLNIQKELAHILKSEVRQDEPMSRHTTLRIGGPADIFVSPNEQDFIRLHVFCVAEDIPLTIIGNGSNLLVGDGGVRGVVAEIGANMARISAVGDRIMAQAGALLGRVAEIAADNALTGLEFAHGIPGSTGGALVMNAGAYGGEIKDVLVAAEVLSGDGVRVVQADELELSYRTSRIQREDAVVLSAEFKLERGDEKEIRGKMSELRTKRTDKQPLEFPSAGSTFKRPEGHFAGKLIEEAGLRGKRIGGAQVSEKHCGFIINTGGASADDVKSLIEYVQEKVRENSGIMLEPEVKMIGEFKA